MRNAVVALALTCAAVQVAPVSARLAGALSLGLHATAHSHSASLVVDEGHVDVVLSHEAHEAHEERGHGERDPRGRTLAVQHRERATSSSETDHVFHLVADDATGTAPRPAGLAPTPAVARADAISSASTPQRVLFRAPGPRSRSSDALRTIVLRL